MKRSFFLLISICISATLLAQMPDSVKAHPTRHGNIDFFGVSYPCSISEYDAPPDVVEAAVKEYMQQHGHKADSRKGFLVYRNVRLTHVHNGQPVDMFVLVEAKSRQEKEKTIVHTITAEPGKIPDKKPEKGAITPSAVVIAAGGAAMLSHLGSNVAGKEHVRQLGLQQAVVLKNERKLKDLQDDLAAMQKKVEQLQKDMAQNQKDQEAATKLIEEEKKKLAELEAKKPGTGN
jgi:hypothetical protein